MFCLRWVELDALHSIELVAKENSYNALKVKANALYADLIRPGVTELEAFVSTVDVKFSKNSEIYTYIVDTLLVGYSKIDIEYVTRLDGKRVNLEKKQVQIVQSKYRTRKDLEALAKSKGFSFNDYKVLHGTAKK